MIAEQPEPPPGRPLTIKFKHLHAHTDRAASKVDDQSF
jgi:hypothetical protein